MTEYTFLVPRGKDGKPVPGVHVATILAPVHVVTAVNADGYCNQCFTLDRGEAEMIASRVENAAN